MLKSLIAYKYTKESYFLQTSPKNAPILKIKKTMVMEYIAIDKELYNEIVATISTASQEIREEYRLYQESVGSEWIENDELSRLLSLSKHQLKGYRGRGLLGYTMIGNKIYYKRREVERFIKRHINK